MAGTRLVMQRHVVHVMWPVAAPEGRNRVGFSLCEAAEGMRSEGSRRRDERRRREGRGAIGAEGVEYGEGVSPSPSD